MKPYSKLDEIVTGIRRRENRAIARAISLVENGHPLANDLLAEADSALLAQTMILGITGAPGAGKSTLTDKLITYCRSQGERVGMIAIDPSSPVSGGAILGDRIRMMQHARDEDVLVRSMATRGRLGGLCAAAGAVTRIMAWGGCNPIIIETVGVGQSEMDIIRLADVTALVSAPGLGDDIQALKAGLLEVADLMVVNKADRPGAEMLAMELKEVARQKGRDVLLTIASQGVGIKELYSLAKEIFAQNLQNGETDRRRQKAKLAEVVDWCLEMLRPDLAAYVQGLEGLSEHLSPGVQSSGEANLGTRIEDPRILASRIYEKLRKAIEGKDV